MDPTLEKLLRWAGYADIAPRAEAAHLLRNYADEPAAAQALASLAHDRSAEVRGHAIASLQALKPPAAFLPAEPTAVRDASPKAAAKALRTRRAPKRTGKLRYYDEFRRHVLDGDHDPAIDEVYMLAPADWAELEHELSAFPLESMSDLIAILGSGPADGLRILARLLLDPQRGQAASKAIAQMSETHADDMALSTGEAALLGRYLSTISPELASVIERAVPDARLPRPPS